jgi:hypothetical protein
MATGIGYLEVDMAGVLCQRSHTVQMNAIRALMANTDRSASAVDEQQLHVA